MEQKLEDIANGKKPPHFKSIGERKIANFLSENSIKYEYERGVLVNAGDNKQRIWYPDFFLQEFKTYIEYYGMVGNQNYDQGIKTKQAVYDKAGMDVISIYPWMFKENWRGYIMHELERNTLRPYRSLMAKPYWSNNRSSINNYRSKGDYH
jgi:hypothetical protein